MPLAPRALRVARLRNNYTVGILFPWRMGVLDISHQLEVISLPFLQTGPYCSHSSHSQGTQMEPDPAHPAVDTVGVGTTGVGLGRRRLQKVPVSHLMLTLPTGPPRSCHPLKCSDSECYK